MFGIKLLNSIRSNVLLQLVVLFLLISFNYAVVAYFDLTLSEVEKTINLAGSNRTSIQQISLYTKYIIEGKEEYKKLLKEVIEKHDNNLNILKGGGNLALENDSYIAPIPDELDRTSLQPVQKLWSLFKKNADVAAESPLLLKNKELNPEVEVAADFVLKNTPDMYKKDNDLVSAYLVNFDKQQIRRDMVLFVIFVINIGLLLLLYIYIRNNVIRPISKINEIDAIVSEGNFERNISYNRDDELGKVGRSINRLFQNLRNATDFIIAIGEGKLDTRYQRMSETDAKTDKLGTALLEMREKMIEVAENDRQRNWVSEGLAKFADIFRTYNDSEDFTYIIISNLVNYVEANQGGLFIVEDEEGETPHLELVAAYAFEKRKYLKKRIAKGEGLVGEVYQEGGKIYITDVPDNYVHITSGLGDANPRSILLVPLKLNDEIYGVLELASFKPFEPYKIEFVEKLSESIASTFASVKTSSKTQKLLRESIQLSEQMKSQEEEMRQNLEELVATQEEVQRKNQAIEQQKVELEKMLEEEQQKIVILELQQGTMRQTIEELRMAQKELEINNRALSEQRLILETELQKQKEKYFELESRLKEVG